MGRGLVSLKVHSPADRQAQLQRAVARLGERRLFFLDL